MQDNIILNVQELKIFKDSLPISCDIERDKITAIFGMNGTGKTLLLKSVFGIFKYHSGRVDKLYDKADVGILLQSPEDLLYKEKIIDEAIMITGSKVQADELLKQIGANGEQGSFTLSDGQKRLIFIFGYLISKKVLFFDEPFASVDKVTHKIIADKFIEAKSYGKTIIYTANRKCDTEVADMVVEIK